MPITYTTHYMYYNTQCMRYDTNNKQRIRHLPRSNGNTEKKYTVMAYGFTCDMS